MKKTIDKIESRFIFLCWLAYTVSYLGRYSYNANISLIIEEYGVTHSQAGLVTTFYFFAYGVGQIINGLFCKYYPKRRMLAAALTVSAGVNAIAYVGVPFAAMKYLWLVNGLALSVLWSSIILALSQHISRERLPKAIIVMSTTVAVGNCVAYLIGGLLAKVNYRLTFLAATVALLVVAAYWLATYDRCPFREQVSEADTANAVVGGGSRRTLVVALVMLGIFAISDNLIKDGLHTWIPSVLKETFGFDDGNSILLTMVLNLLGVGGAVLATVLQKVLHNLVGLTTVLFAASTVFMALICALLRVSFLTVFLSFGLTLMLLHAVNNVITSMAPLYLRERANPGTVSGLLNGCCYLGSTLSSYGLGLIADRAGWDAVFSLMLYAVIAMTVVGAGYFAVERIRSRSRV